MRDRTWLLLVLYGVLLVSAVSSALKGTRPKFKIATTSTTTEKPKQPDNETATNDDEIEGTTSGDINATTSRTLTGIPQIDYIWDPNLPRELNGYNLSDYPFYSSIPNPEEIDFKCDGLHDGFYASVPHKCQVYHHCLYGTRYDFLCANFTAFDQKTFICHFASEVDCANSKKFWHRNDALYKAASTSTAAPPPTTSTTTTTSSTTTTSTTQSSIDDGRSIPRRRRPFRRRPAYDYYDEEYYDDEYERPRVRGGYDRRDEYDYDDRQYSRRDNRERDRDHMRNRDRNYRDPVVRTRERIPNRNNWRDTASSINRQPDEVNDDDRGVINHHDDRRYEKGSAKYDYEQEPSAPSGTGGLVKPAAPSTSVYSRPRTPPKIRRPVPLSAQDKFAYKTSAVQPTVGDSHKRPTEPVSSVGALPPSASTIPDDDYYEDEVEDTRPRRPMRRRPFRERERHFYDQTRSDLRDKERIRPMRTRYRDDNEDMRSKKYPERPRERDRFYERSRDRALDREKDLLPDRIIEEHERESRPALRNKEPLDEFIETSTRKNNPANYKNSEIITRTMQQHDVDDDITEPHRHLLSRPHKLKSDKQIKSNRPIVMENEENDDVINNHEGKINQEALIEPEKSRPDDEYDYYDETEYSPPSSPRTAVRIVKRPFLPSRGGNPNPRGLSPVGSKAPQSNKNENNNSTDNFPRNSQIESNDEHYRGAEKFMHRPSAEDKRNYNAYKIIQNDMQNKQQIDDNGGSNHRRPITTQDSDDDLKPIIPWNAEEDRVNLSVPSNTRNRDIINDSNRDIYNPTYTTESTQKEANKVIGSTIIKQRINEVQDQLQDIPESEFDVALNEALTPSIHQESTLPSGFILPAQRHQNRDPVLQSSENNYRISRPYNNQHQSQQQLQHHHQNGFIPSTQFVPLIRAGNGNNNDDRSGSVQYFKTPAVHVPGPSHSRQSGRGPWHDYTVYSQ